MVFFEYLKTYSTSLILFLGLYVIIQLIDYLGAFLQAAEKNRFETEEYLLYFIYNFPLMGTYLVPVTTLFTIVFVLGRLNSQNELMVYYTSGKSIYYLVRPIVLLTLLISSCYLIFDKSFVYDNHFKHVHLHNKMHGRAWRLNKQRNNLSIFGTENKLFLLKKYIPGDAIMEKAQILYMDPQKHAIDKLIAADKIQYKLSDDTWIASDVVIRKWRADKMKITKKKRLALKLEEKPFHFEKDNKGIEHMSAKEVIREARKLEITGGKFEEYYTEFYFKTAMPFLPFIILFIGIPLSTSSKRSNVMISLLMVVIVAFVFFVTSYAGRSMGKIGLLSPFLAGWFGNIVFSVIALYFYKRFQL